MKLLESVTVFLMLLALGICFAQVAKKIPVAVYQDGEDQVGRGIAFALKEAIHGSQSFTLVDHDWLPESPRIVIYLISEDIGLATGSDARGRLSAISGAILYSHSSMPGGGAMLTSIVKVCGRDAVERCAKQITNHRCGGRVTPERLACLVENPMKASTKGSFTMAKAKADWHS